MVLVLLKSLVFPSRSNSQNQCKNADLENHIKDATRRPSSLSDTLTSGSDSEPLLKKKRPTEDGTNDSKHRIDPRVISDAIIGLADGLTVPFALTAGLSALGNSKIVISGGMAELMAGAISMGLGGWLAARSEAEAYHALLTSTTRLVNEAPRKTASFVRTAIQNCIPTPDPSSLHTSDMDYYTSRSPERTPQIDELLSKHILQSTPEQIISFIMAFYHRTSPPSDSRGALTSAATIAAGYFLGGFVPLVPYFFIKNVGIAFWWSVGVVCIALFAFGACRYCYVDDCGDFESISDDDDDDDTMDAQGNTESTQSVGLSKKENSRKSLYKMLRCAGAGLQMLLLGMLAACAAMGFVKAFDMR